MNRASAPSAGAKPRVDLQSVIVPTAAPVLFCIALLRLPLRVTSEVMTTPVEALSTTGAVAVIAPPLRPIDLLAAAVPVRALSASAAASAVSSSFVYLIMVSLVRV